jgi:hypothetical protein
MLLAPALWKHYTDEQLLELNQRIVASIPPPEVALASKWMMRGLNNNDAISWLKDVKENAPQFVFDSLISIAANELSAHRFSMIEEAITGSAVPA